MSVPLSQVKPVTTAVEYSLVKQSRTPELNKLPLARVRQLAARARTALTKWQDRTRQQSRTKARASGAGAAGERTQLKQQIFQETLDAYEARLAVLSEAKGKPKPVAARAKPSTRAKRTTEHRAKRASVRKELAEVVDEKRARRLSSPKKATAKTADSAATAQPAETTADKPTKTSKAAAKPKTKPSSTPRSPAAVARKTTTRTGKAASTQEADPERQLKAVKNAKQNRIAASGLTTRVRGHVSARGKRKQARRDGN